jgi:Mn2+/Fe2+ NRAMP family transporter
MPRPSDDNDRVVSFRPRRAKSGETARWRAPIRQGDPGILLSFAKFERDDREDDYRHRMIMNVLAFIVLLVLTIIGVWLAVNINDRHHAALLE